MGDLAIQQKNHYSHQELQLQQPCDISDVFMEQQGNLCSWNAESKVEISRRQGPLVNLERLLSLPRGLYDEPIQQWQAWGTLEQNKVCFIFFTGSHPPGSKSFGYISITRMAGSYNNFMFNFFEELFYHFLQKLHYFVFPPPMHKDSSFQYPHISFFFL